MKRGPVRWSGLLVSVRDAAEAEAAVAGGAAIVDVKEPLHGPLGMASPAAVAAVATAVAGRAPWTIACGELAAGAETAAAFAALPADVAGPAAAKAGPAGLTAVEWPRAFAEFAAALPSHVEAIAVTYADWQAAAAPHPRHIIDAAAALGCRTLLIDTFDKTVGSIVRSAAAARLPEWVAEARQGKLAIALAGRLSLADIPWVVALGADVVAVRSAACHGGRLGRIDRERVAAAAAAVECPPAGTLVEKAAAGRDTPAECHVP